MRPLEQLHDGDGRPVSAKQLWCGTSYTEKEGLPEVRANRAANCARGLPAIPAAWKVRDQTVAIVGYGPSLLDTWPLLHGFDTIWTTSKAHDFLMARGIVPAFHTDVDYRAHKARYNRDFRDGIRYVMATHVHPDYLEALAGKQVSLFHVFLKEAGPWESGYAKAPSMFDAGLTAAERAYDLGYRKQVWFGLDASHRAGQRHAGPHEGLRPGVRPVIACGRAYESSDFLIRQAWWAENLLKDRPKLKVTITGDGMLKPFLKDRGRVAVQ